MSPWLALMLGGILLAIALALAAASLRLPASVTVTAPRRYKAMRLLARVILLLGGFLVGAAVMGLLLSGFGLGVSQ